MMIGSAPPPPAAPQPGPTEPRARWLLLACLLCSACAGSQPAGSETDATSGADTWARPVDAAPEVPATDASRPDGAEADVEEGVDAPEAGSSDAPATEADGAPEIPARPAPLASACLADPTCGVPLLTAHRGEGVGAPENSLEAIRLSAERGADLVEVDIRQSADGVPVLMHDGTLDRTTNQPEVFPGLDGVDDLTLAQLETLVLYDQAGVCTPETAAALPERCRIPSLAAALAVARDRTILMLDFKSADVGAVADAIVGADAADRVLFFDSDTDLLDAVEALVPGLVTMPRAGDATETAALIAARAPAIVHIDAAYLDEAAPAAAAAGVKLYLNIFVEVDPFLALDPGDGSVAAEGIANLHAILAGGAQVLQTNLAPDLRLHVDAWWAAQPRVARRP